MSDSTHHATKEELRKAESKVSQAHHGQTPANSDVSGLKSVLDSNTNKAQEIEERKANLPLPEQPPTASDWQSMSQEATGAGAGGAVGGPSAEESSALREPVSVDSSVRGSETGITADTQPGSTVGRQGHDNLNGLPQDAKKR